MRQASLRSIRRAAMPLLVSVMLTAAVASDSRAADPAPGAKARGPGKTEMLGRYGFNWSKPDAARCERVTEAIVKRLATCQVADTGSFTGKSDHVVCTLPDGEFLAFPNEARCLEELETMQANAP